MKVALVNVNGCADYTMLGGRANAALNVLEDALTLEGHEVRLFPSHSIQGRGSLYTKKLAGYVVDYDPDVVGISSTSPDFKKLVPLSNQIKMLEDIPIYVGGPHFQFDYFNYRKKILNSVMDALLRPADDKRMIVDGVNVGGGGAFVDYLKNPDSSPEGIYRLEKNQIIGSGEGRFPNISRAPFAFEHSKWKKVSENGRDYTLMIMGNSRCPNHCDYCVIEDINITISPEMIEKAIPKRLERFSQIALADSAPFLNTDYYDEVLGRIRKRVKSIPISVNLDPSALIRDRERIYEIVIKHDLRSFFIGREVTSEKAAQAIGRRYLREVRTEERLMREKKELLEFFRFLGRLTPGYLVAIAYIFSPFDSKEEIIGKLDEMVEFAEKAPDNVRAVFVPSVLEAWPGTPIRQEHIDKLFRPGDYMGPLAYSWNPIMFPKHTLFFEAVQKVPGVGNVPIELLLGLKEKAKEIFG